MNRAARYGTAAVLGHLLLTIVHGQAHLKAHITMDLASKLFAVVVILLAPLVAMGLLWGTLRRLGLVLLSLSFAGAFLFGFYHHFLVAGHDNVSQTPAGAWGKVFSITAYLLLLSEGVGAYVGVHFWGQADGLKSASARKETDGEHSV